MVRPLPAFVLLLPLVTGPAAPADSTDRPYAGKLGSLMDRDDLERDHG